MPKRAARTAVFISLSLFLSSFAIAADSFYLHQPRISARIMGMGGAFAALADDYNALYFNPAGLSRLQHSELNLQLTTGVTPSLVSFYNNLSQSDSNVSNTTTTIIQNEGQHYGVRFGLGMTYVNKSGWGLGIQPADLTAELDITGINGGAVGAEAFNDTLVQYGLSWNFGKALSIGIAPKAVYRGFVEKNISAIDLVQNPQVIQPSDATEGMTVDADLGALYTFPVPDTWVVKPSVAVVVRNIVDEGFFSNFHAYGSKSQGITNTDGYMGRRIDVGTRFDLPQFWAFNPRVLIDARDMGYIYASTKKCLHAGVELPWKATESITGAYRIGMSEGYFTAGFSFYLGWLEADVATYSDEIGTTDAPQESRRYLAQFSIDF